MSVGTELAVVTSGPLSPCPLCNCLLLTGQNISSMKKSSGMLTFYLTFLNMKKHTYMYLLIAVMCYSLHFIKVLFLVYSLWKHFPKERHAARSFLLHHVLIHTL